MQTQKITPFSQQNIEYLEAFNAVKAAGKQLPTNADYDELLKSRDYKRFSPDGDYWCLDWILYPESGKALGSGDQSDSDYSFTLQAKYIPKSAVGKRHIAVRLLPERFEEKDGTTYVIPIKGSVRVQSFPDNGGWYGFDPITRIPTNTAPKSNDKWDERYCSRRSEQTLRPLVRWDYYDLGLYIRRLVFAFGWPYYRRGVGVVSPQRKLRQAQADTATDETFRTRALGKGKFQAPRGSAAMTVKKGRLVEVSVRTL